jgi:hypothetical protein
MQRSRTLHPEQSSPAHILTSSTGRVWQYLRFASSSIGSNTSIPTFLLYFIVSTYTSASFIVLVVQTSTKHARARLSNFSYHA